MSRIFEVQERKIDGKQQLCVVLNSSLSDVVVTGVDRLSLEMIAASLDDAVDNSIDEMRFNRKYCRVETSRKRAT